MEKQYITHNAHGRVDKFEIVDNWQDGYYVWPIGRHNFPFECWLPLCKDGRNEEPWQCNIDLTSLKAIKVRDEATALRCFDAAVKGTARTKEDYLRIINQK